MAEQPYIFDGGHLLLESNCDRAKIIVDYDTRIEEKTDSGTISINMASMPQGWHYIEIYGNHLISYGIKDAYVSFMLHVIPKQPDVFVPISVILEAREGNLQNHRDYKNRCVSPYTPKKPYFYEKPHDLEGGQITMDDNGILMFQIDHVGWVYHPVVIIQEALGQYNEYLEAGDGSYKKQFLRICNWLADNQENTGAYTYPYSADIKSTYTLHTNFVSGMAQGQALSVFARAYILTGDDRYLIAGQKCLTFMLADGSDEVSGTKRSLADFTRGFDSLREYSQYYLFEEYLTNPCFYVLNGDLFALVGLYDWQKTATKEYGSIEAGESFAAAVKAIAVLLPYYDFYGWSCYDLYWHTSDGLEQPYFYNSYAHQCHIYLLDFLSQVTDNNTIAAYSRRFKMYADDDFWRRSGQVFRRESNEKL